MPESKDSARTTVILAVCTVALGFYVLGFGLQTLVCEEVHRWAFSAPYLKAVPQPLPTTIASPVQQRDIQFYATDFAAPWKGTPKKTEGDALSEADFPSGPVVIVFNPSGEPDIVGRIRGGDPQTVNRYQSIFGTDFFRDNYSLYEAVYSAAPNDVWPFTPRSKAIRINTLLIWKLRFGMNGARTIYSIQTENMRGFQLGDPSRDKAIVVQLFDDQGGQYKMLFASKSGQPGTIPQADINCVIYSFKNLNSGR